MLVAESLIPVTFRAGGLCVVDTGQLFYPYTGLVFTRAADLDVDHVVALGNAHRREMLARLVHRA